jgi:hypothetical protein
MLPFALGGGKDDLTGGDWGFILLCGLVLLAAAILVFIPILIATRRGSATRELILAGSFFWGVAAAGVALSAVMASWNWAKEKNTLMLSGYYKTVAHDPGPALPWTAGMILAGLYAVLLVLALRRKS